LESIRTDEPINLGWDKVCEIDRTILCDRDTDCPAGQLCLAASPELTFKHQISLVDHRTLGGIQLDRSADRAVVGAQLADVDGQPIGNWIKLQPFVNVYDTQANSLTPSTTATPKTTSSIPRIR